MSTLKSDLSVPARRGALPLAPLEDAHASASAGPTTAGHEAHHHTHVGCDCGHEHAPRRSGSDTAGFWASVGPVLACAVCPACLSTYAKVFAATGVGFALTESQHHALLFVALGASLLFAAHRSWRTRRGAPLAISVVGAALVFTGHAVAEIPWLGWLGVAVLLVGGLAERQIDRRRASRPAAARSGRSHASTVGGSL